MLALKSRPSWMTFALLQIILILAAALGFVWWKSAQPKPVAAVAPRTIVERIIQKATSIGSLDRGAALEVLNAHSDRIDPGNTQGVFLSGVSYQGDAVSAFLRSQGFIACSGGTSIFSHGSCALTAKGRAQNWKTEPADRWTKVVIPLADARATRITGIQASVIGAVSGTAVADFTYILTPKPLGQDLAAFMVGRKFCGTEYAKEWKAPSHTGQAAFSRYDDGFRISGVSVAGSSPFAISNCFRF